MANTRKYLCAAPHPSTWEERAQSLLQSLGKDPKKRRRALERTLSLLASSHPQEIKKSGPGRKSNAEHAINFYRFALQQIDQNMDVSGADDSEDELDDDNTAASKMSSVNTEEFFEQHNDLCEVCNAGGELVCCNTCNLVFHMGCTRPAMQKLPPGSWSCSYCVASGVTRLKKDSKLRKRAAAACRQMDRMKEEKEEEDEKKAGDKQEHEKEENINNEERIEPVANVEPEKYEKVEQKTPELSKTIVEGEKVEEDQAVEGGSLASPDTPEGEGSKQRGRRERRPPTIYDPQAGPASSWQSDERLAKIGGENETSDSDDSERDSGGGEGSGADASDSEKKTSEGPVWCSFCKDDSSIPICCFCACRVCFGKHSGDKLLLCDKCDQEYHTFCLKPPLVSVPASKKWFCPSCKSTKTKSGASPATGTRASTQGTTRGRPKKYSSPLSESSERWRVRDSSGKFANKPSSRGRKSGRASPSPSKRKSPGTPSTSSASKRHKKRGRLTKSQTEDPHQTSRSPTSSSSRRSSPSQRKPSGMPASKKATKSGGAQIDDRRGPTNAPPLTGSWSGSSVAFQATDRRDGDTSSNLGTGSHSGAALENGKEMNVARLPAPGGSVGDSPSPSMFVPALPPQRSRSGRTVKRNSFHDEVEEGEQHLRVTKFRMSSLVPARNEMQVATGVKVQVVQEDFVAGTASQAQESQSCQPTTAPPATVVVNVPVVKTSTQEPSQSSSAVGTNVPVSKALPDSSLDDTPAQATLVTGAGSKPSQKPSSTKVPRRKPGARECIQISRRFGVQPIPQKYMDTLLDYCTRGKVEHLIRMRERLDDHARFLESQLAGLESLVKEKGELDITVPPAAGEATNRFSAGGHGA